MCIRDSIYTLTPVFIGTGDYELDAQGIYQPFFRRLSRIIIPGTSVKGVVRSYAEALSPSCEAARCSGDNLCICCAIFGTLGFQGRITFLDGELQEPNSVNTQILCVETRWEPILDGGRKFYMKDDPQKWITKPPSGERLETVGGAVNFTCDLHFQSLTRREIGLLLFAMGLSPGHRFNLKLGGGKNRGLGSVRFSILGKIRLTNNDNSYTSFAEDVQEKEMDDWGNACVEEYLQSLSEQNREEILKDILQQIQNS